MAKVRGSHVLAVTCAACKTFICNYQKVGESNFVKMYNERIIDGVLDFSEYHGAIFCPDCGERIATRYMTKMDKREAYGLVPSAFHRRQGMKRLLFLFIVVLFVFTACNGDVGEVYETYVLDEPEISVSADQDSDADIDEVEDINDIEDAYEPYEPYEAYEPYEYIEAEITRFFDLEYELHEFALYYFTKLEAIWDEENGEIWGVPLHAPVIIACEETHNAVANQPDPQGALQRVSVGDGAVYVGRYTGDIPVGATAPYWNGIWWGMMPIQMIQQIQDRELPGGSAEILRVLAHEAFHAIQRELHGLYGAWGIFNWRGARESFLQELNALVTALDSEGDERIMAIGDALAIRNARRQAFHTRGCEIRMELAEGLAVYTADLRLMLDPDVINRTIRGRVNELADHDDFIVSIGFGYMSGALYALLLNELGADWKEDVNASTDLGELLKNAAGITELRPINEIDLNRYFAG